MAKYGNILTAFNMDDLKKTQIETVLSNNKTVFVNYNNVYFIETSSKTNTGDVIKSLSDLGIEFIIFHNNISDGSIVKANGIDAETINKIDKILF